MIVNRDRKTKKEIYLVPECCYMTGLTDAMRNDFHLMKDISLTTKCEPGVRLNTTK